MDEWPLPKIREAYREILSAYDEICSLHPKISVKDEDITPPFDQGEDVSSFTVRKRMTAILPKIKEGADRSGNAVIWYRGDSLEGLSSGMRDRVERALKFGI
jgi:hypothetical protein